MLRFNEEEPDSPERTMERLVATHMESPGVSATETRDEEVVLTVIDEVEIAMNAALPKFKKLDPMRAAKAAIRVARLSQEAKSKGKGNKTKELVDGHLRQQLGVATPKQKGTARFGSELLMIQEGVNLFAYKKDDASEALDCNDGGVSLRNKALTQLEKAMNQCGNEEQKCYLLHHYLMKPENQSIAMTLGVLKCPEKDHGTADVIVLRACIQYSWL